MTNKQFSMDINNCGFVDPQIQLGAALAKAKIRDFREALDMGADAAQPADNHVSVFEQALSTYGCADFVRECLQRGCNPNHVNPHWNKAAVSFAADSRDPKILRALLSYEGVLVNRKYQELTPLNSLAKHIDANNQEDVIACIQLLLNYGASPNIPDQREMTPLHYILKNRSIDEQKKRELVQWFTEQPYLDVDTYRDGEVRSLLADNYPEIHAKLPKSTEGQVDIHTLLKHLRDEEEDEFLQKYKTYQMPEGAKKQEDNMQLLLESIRRGMHRALNELLKSDIDINVALKSPTPIETACIWGNWFALKKLLEQDNLKLKHQDHPLITIISKMNQPANEVCDYNKCFDILLDSELIDVNEVDDSGSTPLHYAVKYRNRRAIKELLRHGAYIGMKSTFSDLALDGIHLDLLEEHFDNCITTNNRKLGDPNFEILINFKNLIPQQSATHSENYNFREEMPPIAFIAESKEHRHLLQHPLITSFLFLKWHRLSVIFYINLLIYSFFAVSIITHTVLKFRESDQEAVTLLFGLLSWIGIIYMIFREAVQFIISPSTYLLSFTNLMECVLIILSILTCTEQNYDRETQRVIAVFTILLVALELCLLVGSLPVLSISTHMLMLRAVTKSFIKSFTFYSIFVITFSLCFYILFGKQSVDENGVPKADEGGEFNKFTSPVTAIIKTIVMLTGEFDAGDIDFNSLYSYLIFLLFVVFMSIVLFNLLNGLAVSDTQAIRAQAELNGAICRTNLLSRYEQVFANRSGRINYIFRHEPFRSICRRVMNIYPNYIVGREIAIQPNDGNKVLIPTAGNSKVKESMSRSNGVRNSKTTFLPLTNSDSERQMKLLDPPVPFVSCCCGCLNGKCAEMDSRTVKLAMAVIEQKVNAQKDKQRLQNNEQRLQNIENKLEKLYQLLQGLQTQ